MKKTNLTVLAMPAFKNEHSNPYNYLLYRAIEDASVEVKEFSFRNAVKLDYDLIHIHWPEFYLNSHYFSKALVYASLMLVCLIWAKLFGKKIVWTVHNLHPHSITYPKISKIYWWVFLRLLDGVISLSKANEKQLLEAHPMLNKLHRVVTYHGLYSDYYEDKVKPEDAKVVLDIPVDKQVFLVLGQVKPYKNVERLIDLFKQNKFENCILLIAGKAFSQQYYQELVDKIDGRENIIFHEGFVQDANLQAYFSAANYSVIPFTEIFNSGSALLSASFNTPAFLPYSENFQEYNDLLDDMFITFKDSLSESIQYRLSLETSVDQKAPQFSEQLSWPHIGKKTAGFYELLVSGDAADVS